MQTRLIHQAAGQKTYAVILSSGDEVMACLEALAASERLSAASFKAIGAFERAELAYFDWQARRYRSIPVDEQSEVAAFTGDIVLGPDGAPAVHVHAVLGLRDGSARAGHLKSGTVRPTLEIVLTESPVHLRKRWDAESGIPLIALDEPPPTP